MTAIQIAMQWYKVSASKILSDVYIKNLNAEHENDMGSQALVSANKKLYSNVCLALQDAARTLGINGFLNIWIISSNINRKIPKDDLHEALQNGGAESIKTDNEKHQYRSGSNDGEFFQNIKTNLHLATLRIKP